MRKLTLTFDNGPTPGITDRVLDALDEADVRATFFLVGTQLEQPGARALAERARRAGHRFGNHTLSHGDPLGLQSETGRSAREIIEMDTMMGDLVGSERLFRPNGRGRIGPHLLSGEAVHTLVNLEATVVLWHSVPRDRAAVVDEPDRWVRDAQAAVLSSDWTLMVLHDRPSGFPAPGPMAFLSSFLHWAKQEVEFVMEFPEDCTPMIRGSSGTNLQNFVTP